MTGWRLLVALLAAFGSGWIVASWFALIRNEATQTHLLRRALAAEANTDHKVCMARHAALADYIDHLEGGGDVADEAEEWLKADVGHRQAAVGRDLKTDLT